MKVQKVSEGFKPYSITIETEQEHREFMAALSEFRSQRRAGVFSMGGAVPESIDRLISMIQTGGMGK